MVHSDRRVKALAAGLAVLAGYVDATGFIVLGGYFIAFMSGNSTRMAVGLVKGTPSPGLSAMLIASFVLGVIAGSLVGHFARRNRETVVLLVVALLLAAAATMGGAGQYGGAVIAMALAMGAENTVFERDGEVRIGVTYMTGTLVKLGQRITGAILGGDRFAWVGYLLLWMGLVAGAAAGAFAFPHLGWNAMWLAAAAAAIFAAFARIAVPRDA
jgi:uncharacterized membrane protein YoaK (UPF0700 family)